MRWSYVRHGVSAEIPHQIDVSRSKKIHLRAVQKSYGHNKHINAIWRAQDAVKRNHEGTDRGDDVLFWPLDHWFLKLKLKLKMISGDYYFFI
jgi:hypothetical protein